jgi:DsbC/DsbD-like thiol-disulfide interchange protein
MKLILRIRPKFSSFFTNAETSKIEAELNYQVCKDVCIKLEKSSLFDSFEASSTPKIENQQ